MEDPPFSGPVCGQFQENHPKEGKGERSEEPVLEKKSREKRAVEEVANLAEGSSFTFFEDEEFLEEAASGARGFEGRSVSRDEIDSQGALKRIRAAKTACMSAGVQGRGLPRDEVISQDALEQIRAATSACIERLPASPRLADLGDVISTIIFLTQDPMELCRPRPMAGKADLFPIPADDDVGDVSKGACFKKALAFALNSLAGQPLLRQTKGGPTSVRAKERLGALVECSPILREELPSLDFPEFFKTRTVDYMGEEVRVAKPLTWESLEPALPAEVGLLHLRDYCQGGVLHYVDHFTDFLVPTEEQFMGKPPRVNVSEEEWAKVAEGLLKCGICEVISEK